MVDAVTVFSDNDAAAAAEIVMMRHKFISSLKFFFVKLFRTSKTHNFFDRQTSFGSAFAIGRLKHYRVKFLRDKRMRKIFGLIVQQKSTWRSTSWLYQNKLNALFTGH